MSRGSYRVVVPLVFAVSMVTVCPPHAEADLVACQRKIVKGALKFVQTKAKTLAKCEETIVKGKLVGPCPDPKAATKIARAASSLAASIDKACGGTDKVCGGNRTDEYTPADLGWPVTCPNVLHGACTNTISDCGGIATCIACVGETAVDQAVGLIYDDLALPSSGAVRSCQLAIGKAAVKFHATKTKALQKCWEANLLGA
ncbi:MAG: hypothetical protein ABIR79_08405, partial [Candidatus Binatia bacterium]